MGDLVLKNSNTFIEVPAETNVYDIVQALPVATDLEIKQSIAMLFTARKSGNRGDDDAAMTVEVYSIAISEYPAYAIEAAVKAIIKGKAPNIAPIFVPSTDELVGEVERQMWLRIRRAPEPQSGPEVVLPDNHFSKRWEDMKSDALNGKVLNDE